MVIFGINYCGKIKNLVGQYIKTKFFHIFWMPVIPLGSMYILNEDGNDVQGFPIGLSFKSTLLAYPRRYLPILVISIIAGFISEDSVETGLLVIAGIFTALWIPMMFFMGKSGSDEKYDRLLLGMGSGIYAPPEWLKEDTRKNLYGALEESWREKNEGEVNSDWRGAMGRVFTDHTLIPLIYSLARYNQVLNRTPDADQLAHQARQWTQQAMPPAEVLPLEDQLLNSDNDGGEVKEE